MLWLKLAGATAVVFLVLDMIWLTRVSPKLYDKYIGHLRADKVVLWPAVLFYVLFVIGLVVFVIQPAVDAGSWQRALFYGALFGLVTYGTFDLTNNAVLRDWPATITAIDLTWGTFITATTSAVVTAAALRWDWLR